MTLSEPLILDEPDMTLLINPEQPLEVKDYYHAYQSLITQMALMDKSMNDYDYKDIQKQEQKREQLFAAYQQALQKIYKMTLTPKVTENINLSIQYLKQRLSADIYKITLKKDVIQTTFNTLKQKALSDRLTYRVGYPKETMYNPLQITEY